MDIEELTVRNMLKAINAPVYEVGVLGHARHDSRLDSISTSTVSIPRHHSRPQYSAERVAQGS